MHVFITGAGGFIGLALTRHFKSLGWRVSGSSHHEAGLAQLTGLVDCAVRLDLSSTPPTALFLGCDAVVHCAYNPAPGSEEQNVRGTCGHFSAAAAAGVPYQLFMSSHSARPDAPGECGRTKYRLEQVFLAAGHAVVRPGLVVGEGGLYAKQRRPFCGSP
ncbi:NAD-dependent epimerase/dehydratase family protein [Humidesulfovibrio idahonensis]